MKEKDVSKAGFAGVIPEGRISMVAPLTVTFPEKPSERVMETVPDWIVMLLFMNQPYHNASLF